MNQDSEKLPPKCKSNLVPGLGRLPVKSILNLGIAQNEGAGFNGVVKFVLAGPNICPLNDQNTVGNPNIANF